MPRLNIYLPDDVYELADRWRETANLSEICARALKDELTAADAQRNASTIAEAIRPQTPFEREVADSLGLVEAVICPTPEDARRLRDHIGERAATYLDRNICDGSLLAVAGGRQVWSVVRNLKPRRVRTTITALGMHHADPQLLHAHPNALATFVWLLFSPRSEAHIVGVTSESNAWLSDLPAAPYPSYFLVSSCSRFDATSSLARLIGDEATASLFEQNVFGDFAYCFFDKKGHEVNAPVSVPSFRLPAATLQQLSRRKDTRIALIGGGHDKLDCIRLAISGGLCNTLITDHWTAVRLLE